MLPWFADRLFRLNLKADGTSLAKLVITSTVEFDAKRKPVESELVDAKPQPVEPEPFYAKLEPEPVDTELERDLFVPKKKLKN